MTDKKPHPWRRKIKRSLFSEVKRLKDEGKTIAEISATLKIANTTARTYYYGQGPGYKNFREFTGEP